MGKYKILFNGEEQDELYDTYDEADDAARDMVCAYHVGGEELELSNPGDYPYDPNDEPNCEIIKV